MYVTPLVATMYAQPANATIAGTGYSHMRKGSDIPRRRRSDGAITTAIDPSSVLATTVALISASRSRRQHREVTQPVNTTENEGKCPVG